MRRLSIIALAAIALTGCMNREYMEIFDFPGEEWSENQSVVFEFQPTLQSRTDEWMDIVVRHRGDFPYADLTLEVKAINPNRLFWIDTVSIKLADRMKDGEYHWTGRHYSNHYEITRRYREQIGYPDSSVYAVALRQLNDTKLNGILSVGIVASGCRK